MKNRARILWITQTAVFIALLVAVQFITRAAGQFVTGSLVNLVLVTAGATAGLFSGLTVALLSPVFAFLLGIGPAFPQFLPFIIAGNAIIVFITALCFKNLGGEEKVKSIALALVGIIAGAAAKAFFLWLGITKIMIPNMGQLKPPQVTALTASFSWPQLVTALIGGTLALALVPLLRKALKSTRE